MKKKRNYRAERNAARDFANDVMDGHYMLTREWMEMWSVIFDKRLEQIRRRFAVGKEPKHV